REVAGGRSAGAASVVGEVDRSRRRCDERLRTERTGQGVRLPRHEPPGDPEAETSEYDLSAGAVRHGTGGPAEGALERIDQERSSATADARDLGIQERVEEFVGEVVGKRNGRGRTGKRPREPARVIGIIVEARRELQ